MCRLDLCVVLLVLTQVSAIHDSDRHSRNGAHSAADELMRRDSPKVRRSPSQEDADPDEIAQQEAPKQVVRDLLSTAQESRDREAFEAALRDGERIGLDEAELQAFKESFENPQKHYSDSSGAEALIDEQDILQSPQSGSSDSAKSLQTAQAPEDDALGPLLSEAEKEEEKTEKTETGDHGAKDKKVEIDYIGCIIPQWSDGDWICAEAADVPDTQIYDDAQSRTRKKLREGDVCTVECPDPRYWQKPEPSSLVCKSGRWRDEVSRINVKKIRCETGGRWFFMLGILVIPVPCCACCCVFAVMRMRRKKDPAAPAVPPPAQSAAEAQDPAPAEPPAAQAATAEAEAPK